MQFLFPGYLWLALLTAVPVVLYLFRRQSKTVPVSTLIFFKSLAREHRESAWLRRLKRLLSLLLTVLVMLGSVLALARAVFSPGAVGVRSVVVLLDKSASMGAVGTGGETGLERARQILRGRLAALPGTVPVSLVTYDSRPEVVQAKTTNRRALLRALDDVVVRPLEDRPDPALAAAVQIARLQTPAQVWHLTDTTPLSGGATGDGGEVVPVAEPELPDGVILERVPVALEAPVNAGVTAFQIRPVPLQHGKYQAYIQIALSAGAPEALEVELAVKVGAGLAVPRRMDLEPGARQGLVLPVDGAEDQLLEIQVSTPGDCLAADDRVVARLPASRPIVVKWVSDKHDPFTGLALKVIAEEEVFDVWKVGSGAWASGDKPDVVLFDGWPEVWPEGLPAVVINPPGSAGPVVAVPVSGGGIPWDSIRVTNEEHPLLFRVSSSRVSVTQTAVIDTSRSLEPLWFAGSEPVMAAGESLGQRLVVMGFSPQRSENLPLMASYPILIGNAIFWCSEPAQGTGGPVEKKTGSLVETGDGALYWQDGSTGSVGAVSSPSESGNGGFAELDRIGLWETTDGQKGSSLLLSRRETDLHASLGVGSDAVLGEGVSVGGGPVLGDVTRWLLVFVLVVLITESWLFHSRAVY